MVDMAGVESKLTEKVGPLPLVAWVGIAGVGFVIYSRVKNGGVSQATGAATGTGATQTAAGGFVPVATGSAGSGQVQTITAPATGPSLTDIFSGIGSFLNGDSHLTQFGLTKGDTTVQFTQNDPAAIAEAQAVTEAGYQRDIAVGAGNNSRDVLIAQTDASAANHASDNALQAQYSDNATQQNIAAAQINEQFQAQANKNTMIYATTINAPNAPPAAYAAYG